MISIGQLSLYCPARDAFTQEDVYIQVSSNNDGKHQVLLHHGFLTSGGRCIGNRPLPPPPLPPDQPPRARTQRQDGANASGLIGNLFFAPV